MKKGYLILISIVCIILAILLAAGAVSIYLDGSACRKEDPTAAIYTPEDTAEKLMLSAPLFIILVVLLAAGFIPGMKNDSKPVRTVKETGFVKNDPGLKHANRIQVLFIVTAVMLILAGIFNGSARDVLIKAITICTECIGLG